MRDRRIGFIFSTHKQQILRCAQDDTSEKQFFSSLLERVAVRAGLFSSKEEGPTIVPGLCFEIIRGVRRR